jgi:hypothetical protein
MTEVGAKPPLAIAQEDHFQLFTARSRDARFASSCLREPDLNVVRAPSPYDRQAALGGTGKFRARLGESTPVRARIFDEFSTWEAEICTKSLITLARPTGAHNRCETVSNPLFFLRNQPSDIGFILMLKKDLTTGSER